MSSDQKEGVIRARIEKYPQNQRQGNRFSVLEVEPTAEDFQLDEDQNNASVEEVMNTNNSKKDKVTKRKEVNTQGKE